jgi:hypothetical protein
MNNERLIFCNKIYIYVWVQIFEWFKCLLQLIFKSLILIKLELIQISEKFFYLLQKGFIVIFIPNF